MVVGPMKKRMMISFFIGFLVMFLIAAIVVILLFRQYQAVSQDKFTLEKDLTNVCVVSDGVTILAGEEIKSSQISEKRINTSAIPPNAFSSKAMFFDGTTKYAKIDITESTIILDTMYYEDEVLTDDMRIQEFNMLLLPSQLEEGDYVDIRFLLPTGNDYVVVSKKRIIKATEGTVWLQLGELDMQYMSSAIIESYVTEGSILYAIEYAEPTMQSAAIVTYPILTSVKDFVMKNPNIAAQIQIELGEKLSDHEYYRQQIDNNMTQYKPEDPIEVLTQNIYEQIQRQKEERENTMGVGEI